MKRPAFLIVFISVLEVIILMSCISLFESPVVDYQNLFVFTVAVFSIYLYIMTTKAIR